MKEERKEGGGGGIGHTFGVRVDGPLARGLWWRLRRKFIKVSVTGLLSMSYGMIRILLIGSLRSPPYSAAPDFPLFRGQNKTPRNTLFISISTVR